jgi:uracil-DNA glycosylase
MDDDRQLLREEVFGCEACASLGFGFSRLRPDLPLSKFPPVIGSSSAVPLLFIGTNPRISNSNQDLYEEIMQRPDSFHLLAQDVWRGRSYLRFGEPGRHYDLHLAIAEKAFPGRPFSSVAAVTELFLCSTKDGAALPRSGSPCADRYLAQVVRQVQPSVVVAVGAPARAYLASRRISGSAPFKSWIGDLVVPVAAVPHPASWGKKGLNEYIQWAADIIRTTVDGGTTFRQPPRIYSRGLGQRQLAAWLIHSDPSLTAEQLTAQLAAAFPPPAYNVGSRHGPHYLSLYRTGKLEVPDSDPRDW